jgi:hypothetical protein
MLFLRRALTLIPLLAFHALAAPALSPRVCIDAFPSGATNGYISAWIANGSELYDANNQPYTVYQFRATCTIGSVFFNILVRRFRAYFEVSMLNFTLLDPRLGSSHLRTYYCPLRIVDFDSPRDSGDCDGGF